MFPPIFSRRQRSASDEAKFEPFLETSEAAPPRPVSHPGRYRHSTPVGILVITVWSVALLLWSFILLFPGTPSSLADSAAIRSTSHCGNSTAEARALGCDYDTLAQAWVPPACADPETLAEYQSWNTWPGFDSPEDGGAGEQQPLGIDAMAERTHALRYWIQPIDHGMHCVFTLKRYLKLAQQEKELFSSDSYIDEEDLAASLKSMEHHLNHCLSLLTHLAMGGSYAEEDEDIQKWSINRTGFSRCYVRRGRGPD
ncbi:hypothetical protein PG984_011304 [Apiospora sp. TS-2023a]